MRHKQNFLKLTAFISYFTKKIKKETSVSINRSYISMKGVYCGHPGSKNRKEGGERC
jgi:hypothetical protein